MKTTLLKLLILLFPLYLFGAVDLSVTNLHVISPDDGRDNPTFAWDLNPNASGYEISSDRGLNWIDVGEVNEYTFDSLSGGTYDVVVRAYAFNVNVPLFGKFGFMLLIFLFGLFGIKKIKL